MPEALNPWVEEACEVLHDAYEEAAVGAGWETSLRSRGPWSEVPEANKATMRAAVTALFRKLLASPPQRVVEALMSVLPADVQPWSEVRAEVDAVTHHHELGEPCRPGCPTTTIDASDYGGGQQTAEVFVERLGDTYLDGTL